MASKQQIVDTCEHNLFAFAKLLNPHYKYGEIHEEVFSWLSDPNPTSNWSLLLLPRGHLKSHCVAVYTVWRITYRPWITVVYLSAGEDLAKDQLYAIKNMMTSDIYRRYWPEMLNQNEADREQWSAYSFNVDHPDRKRRGVRDHTLIVKTVKSNAIGLHCDLLVPDDVVVPVFADTAVGRAEVSRSLAQFTSILNPNGEIVACGTRYHPEDAYQGMIDAQVQVWDTELKQFVGWKPLWRVFERPCEDSGDGTGVFLWPRVADTKTGEGFGFDPQVLATIRAGYESKGQRVQYYCQYYNDPNAVNTQKIDRGSFQYYTRAHCEVRGSSVYVGPTRLNVFAAMDVAWSDTTAADYTAIAVIGVSSDDDVYILDLAQFKTKDFAKYYEEVINLHYKWGFKKIRIETNAGGTFVAQEIERMCRQNGNALSIDGKPTQKNEGNKRERKAATLEWRYADKKIWHVKGGFTPDLEDQIVQDRPRHDDLVDAFVAAINISKPPGKRNFETQSAPDSKPVYDKRFGGRRGRLG